MSFNSKNSVRTRIRKILFEDTWGRYGSEYMSHPTGEGNPEVDSTVPQDLPVEPNDLMANQLAVEKPPIEDDEYKPDGVKELSRAAAVIADQVPQDQVEFFYKQLQDALEVAVERQNNPETVDADEENTEVKKAEIESENEPVSPYSPVAESSLRKLINSTLKEQISDWSGYDPRYKKVKRADWEEAGHEPQIVKDTIKGKYIAPYYQKAAPSGVNVTSDRLIKQYLRPMMDLKDEERDDVLDYLRFHFRENFTEGDADREIERAFIGKLLKKIVRKLSKGGESIAGRLLPAVIQFWKTLKDDEIKKLIDGASTESASEKADAAALAATLQEEEPDQYEILKDLGLA